MKNISKIGVVAGLTMSVFALAPVMPTYAAGCEVTAGDNYTYTLTGCESGVTVHVKPSTETNFNTLTEDIDYTLEDGVISLEDYVASLANGAYTINIDDNSGLDTVYDGTITLENTIEQTGTYTFEFTRWGDTVTPYAKNDSGTNDPIDADLYDSTVDADGNGTIDLTKYFEDKEPGEYEITFMDDGMAYEETVTITVQAPWTEVEYTVTDGDNQTWTIGSENGLTVRIDAPAEDFQGIVVFTKSYYDKYIANQDMHTFPTEEEYEAGVIYLTEGEDYTIEAGSTIITFTNSFLKKLSAGDYVFNAYWDNYTNRTYGDVYGTFTIAEAVSVPDTGAMSAETASAQAGVTGIAAAVATALAGAVAFIRRKATRE